MGRTSVRNAAFVVGLVILGLGVAGCGGTSSSQPPVAPKGVTSVPGPGYVSVSWQDASDDETGFEIYREAIAGATARQDASAAAAAGTKVGTATANATSFVDLDVELEQAYAYSVLAVNAAGASTGAAAASSATVPIGIDLMVGTNNRRWSPDTNGTIFVVYFMFPESLLADETEVIGVTISGPAGWNDDEPFSYECAAHDCDRDEGFSSVSSNSITAVSGTYDVTVTAAGQTYAASAELADASFKLPSPTDITVTGVSSTGATVAWSAPSGTKSHFVSLEQEGVGGYIKTWTIGPEPTLTADFPALEDGLYRFQVVPFNADVLNYPVKVEPYGLSYQFGEFGVGQFYADACASADQVVSVPDATLQQLVRDAIGMAAGDVTCWDMARLTAILDWEEANVGNLEGLQYALNLEELALVDGEVSDLSPLSDLTRLWRLNLTGNEVTDVGPLANLTNMKQLHLCCMSGHITDVTPLEALTQIEGINLGGHNLGDVTLWPLLSNYPNLRRLQIGDNDLTAFEALADHPDLEMLEISGTVIADLSPVAALTHLVELDLEWSDIADPTPLYAMTQLTFLNLANTGLTDIAFLQDFTNLEDLVLHGNAITSLAPLVANAGIGDGDFVDVTANALDLGDAGVQADIQALLDRGVDLQYDD